MPFPELADEVLSACMDEMARTDIVWRPLVSAPGHPDEPARGIFDDKHEFVDLDDEGVPVSSRSPALGVRFADFPDGLQPAQKDRFIIGGVTYEVFDIHPDGQAGATLRLKEIG